MELEVHFHAIDVVEDVADNTRNDSLLTWVTHHPLHRMCFTRRSLTVREYRSIVTGEHISHNRLRRLKVNFFLRCIRLEDFIEQINFSLQLERHDFKNTKLCSRFCNRLRMKSLFFFFEQSSFHMWQISFKRKSETRKNLCGFFLTNFQ